MTETSVRFAIVGAGLIAAKNAAAIKACPSAELRFVGARAPDKARKFAEEHGVPEYGSLEQATSMAGVDAVYFALPTAVRGQWVRTAIAAGKHVLVEKPVAISTKEAKELTDSAQAAGVVFMDGTMWLQATRTQHINDILFKKRQLGDVLSVSSGFSARFPKDAIASGIRGQPEVEPLGAVGDMAWYTVGMSLFAFQYQFPVYVTASSSYLSTGNTYHCHAMLRFPDDRVAIMDAGFGLALRQRVEISCANGTIVMEDFVNPPEGSFSSFSGPSTAKPVRYSIFDGTSQGGFVLAGLPKLVEMPQAPGPQKLSTDEEVRVHNEGYCVDHSLPVVTDVHEVEMFKNFCKAVKAKEQNPLWIKSSLATEAVVEGIIKSIEDNGKPIKVESPFGSCS